MVLTRLASLVLGLSLAAGLAACAGDDAQGEQTPSAAVLADAPTTAPTAPTDQRRVLAISIDAFNPRALRLLGPSGAPHLHRLFAEGAGTLNARTQVEQTVTLPNHTSMITGRAIDRVHRGHGVTWNDDRPGTTIQRAAGTRAVSSVFTVAHRAGLTTALFSTKTKFSIFDRSWPAAVDLSVIREEQDAALVRLARADLLAHDRGFTFVHLGLADQTGHAEGFLGADYLDAIRRLDALVGRLMTTIEGDADLREHLVVVLTSDHGGTAGTTSHSDRTRLSNFRVPFVVWGRGVVHADLYALNPTFADPGTAQPALTGPQPIRNGDVANLATTILGLDAVPGSRFDVAQRLTAR